MGTKNISIICYADDAVIVAESEDNLQKLLHTFNQTAKQLNMVISTSKTKCMTTSKVPIRCKLEVDGEVIQQVMNFNYLGVEISAFGDIEASVRVQAIKASRIAGCLNGLIFKNKHLHIDTKARIYKTVIRPISTYTAETRPVTSTTQNILESVEMSVIRKINNKTLQDKERSSDLRQLSKIQPINNWVEERRQMWRSHVDRMDTTRLVRIARDHSPKGKRSVGRPKKRWSDPIALLGRPQ